MIDNVILYTSLYSVHYTKCRWVQDLDLGGVATSYGLLKMPRMPELKKIQIQNFTPAEIDVNSIKYSGAK